MLFWYDSHILPYSSDSIPIFVPYYSHMILILFPQILSEAPAGIHGRRLDAQADDP